MSHTRKSRIGLAAVAFATAGFATAETITLLESFEENVDGATHFAADNRRVTSFTQSEANDYDQITDGTKALKVSFENLSGWKQDFNLRLSSEATAVLQSALTELETTPEVGRFYLLYDMTWDKLESDVGWSNNPLNFGGHGAGVQVEWAGGNRVVTMTYDLGAGLPEGFLLNLEGDNFDQTFIRFIFNGNSSLPLDIYVDNIRLLDTKPEGSTTEVTILDSFEESLDALQVTGPRVVEDPTVNEDAAFVTEGAKSAKFILSDDPGGYHQDFTIDLTQYPELEQIFNLPQEERFQYSLAYDWIPESGGAEVNWFQETLNPGGPGMRVTENWNGDGNTRTRVINLGLVDWAFTQELTVVHHSNQPWGMPVNLYLDNLRLINTGASGGAQGGLEITTLVRNTDGTVDLTWQSVEGADYSVESSTNLQDWLELDDGVRSEGETTTFTTTEDGGQKSFFRVRLQTE